MIKDMIYSILTDKQRMVLESQWELDFSYGIPGQARFRVNAYYQRNSLGAAFRMIPYETLTLEELGFPPHLAELAKKRKGFILVTGPTGSGKTTTLTSLINIINETRADHIMTIEDPIEFLHEHKKCMINQREIGSDTKSFSNALKHVLRQDPDVILIGEMRDLETIKIALTAAETGHLVFATLHTQDAAQSINRIIDVFPAEQQEQVRVQLAGCLQGIVAQQLLPLKGGNGRVVAVELLLPTPGILNMIRNEKIHQIYSLMETGAQYGMMTMDQSLAKLYQAGRIDLDVALTRAIFPAELKRILTGS